MIDPSVYQLLERAIDSPVKLQLLLIYYESPAVVLTPSKMVERSCRDIWSVSQALHELADDGILAVQLGMDEPRYFYRPLVEYQEAIERLVLGYDDPIERDHLHRSLRDLASYASFRRANAWERQVAA